MGVYSATKDDALGAHLAEPRLEQRLVELEVGDAVPKEAPESIVSFEDDHVVARAGELLSSREACRPRADDRDALARARPRPTRFEAAGEEGVCDGALDRLDGHAVILERENARGLARRRADAARDLGKVVRGRKAVCCVLERIVGDENRSTRE